MYTDTNDEPAMISIQWKTDAGGCEELQVDSATDIAHTVSQLLKSTWSTFGEAGDSIVIAEVT